MNALIPGTTTRWTCTRVRCCASVSESDSWAFTMHKIQGSESTLDADTKVVVHLGDEEKADGCTYVALSRARTIDQIGHAGVRLRLGVTRLTTAISKRTGLRILCIAAQRDLLLKGVATVSTAVQRYPALQSAAARQGIRDGLEANLLRAGIAVRADAPQLLRDQLNAISASESQ
jgi:hypothetical protein